VHQPQNERTTATLARIDEFGVRREFSESKDAADRRPLNALSVFCFEKIVGSPCSVSLVSVSAAKVSSLFRKLAVCVSYYIERPASLFGH
jgi:hypothetical protein